MPEVVEVYFVVDRQTFEVCREATYVDLTPFLYDYVTASRLDEDATAGIGPSGAAWPASSCIPKVLISGRNTPFPAGPEVSGAWLPIGAASMSATGDRSV